jgi:pilus assembly protein CpaF
MSETASAGQPAVNLKMLRDHLIQIVGRQLEQNPPTAEEYSARAQQTLVQSYNQTRVNLDEGVRNKLLREVMDEVVGYGPIQGYLNDETINEIMVNGSNQVFIERNGKLLPTDIHFENDDHVLRVINRMILPIGRRIDYDSPMVDARLPDGSRVNAVIPPVAVRGPVITIRKFIHTFMQIEDLINLETLSQVMADFLSACVSARLNILVSGPTSSGKTTFLNILSNFIPESERIITIEDAVELQLRQVHVIALETKTANMDGAGQVTQRDLVRNSLRMRPDRIIIGEVRSAEALDMLQAMNTGHNGSLTTLHANSPRDALSRLETMVLMAGLDLPLRAIRRQIASAINLVIHLGRLTDGRRKVTHISEIVGMEGDIITMADLFLFKQTGVATDGTVQGTMEPTGLRPMFTPRLEAAGYKLAPEIFGAGTKRLGASGRELG